VNGEARWGTPQGRRVVAMAVLGSGMAFLDGTVVNVALPTIRNDMDASLAQLQWVIDAYLVTLSALLLLGGALGDSFGRRRVFLTGVGLFTFGSLLCGVAPTIETLVAARGIQGVGGALLVPGSLALLSATMHPDDRARAVGAWSGLTGVASALGPFLGGWLVDSVSWRLAFLINVPVAAAVLVVARGVPESRDETAPPTVDIPGALCAAAGLALLAAGLIAAGNGWSAPTVAATALGALFLVLLIVVERRARHPMLPLGLFRSAQFSGANLVTFAVYAGLGGALFLVVLNLQVGLHYTALEAGVALLPVTLLMLSLSARTGALAQRIGPRIPMTVGPLVVAAGLVLLSRVAPGDHYATTVLPAVLVFGLGLATTVAPLTAAVMAAVDGANLGVGSAVNNGVARLAGLLAVAVLPTVAGVAIDRVGPAGLPGYHRALVICALLCVAGAGAAAATIRAVHPTLPTVQPSVLQPCHDPSRARVGAIGEATA
jgi:EmrB/QacA subfamily drug resistance transporter